jgi:hypothetical protein
VGRVQSIFSFGLPGIMFAAHLPLAQKYGQSLPKLLSESHMLLMTSDAMMDEVHIVSELDTQSTCMRTTQGKTRGWQRVQTFWELLYISSGPSTESLLRSLPILPQFHHSS